MRIIGIVAEYNPFHNGHKYLIDSVKRDGDIVVAVMSGNFVQRGDVAIFDKSTRTAAALCNGVDLVVELPVEASLASAKDFAFSAVETLCKMGVTHLAFGSESGDCERIIRAVDAVCDSRVDTALKTHLSCGLTYPTALSRAVSEIYGDDVCAVIDNPNDTLALEYLLAIKKIGANITPIAIKRKGAMHDKCGENDITSAMHIRKMIYQGDDYSRFVSDNAYAIYKNCDFANLQNAESAVLWQLRQMSADDFANYDVSCEGLHNRIYNAVQDAVSIEDLYEKIKTKRYTLARIKRAVLTATLKTHNMKSPYVRVLGFTKSGEMLLKNAKCDVVTSYKTAKKTGYADYFEKVSKTTDFYALCVNSPQKCGLELTKSVQKI